MNVADVRALKARMEAQICDEVASFHRQSGMQVMNLSLIRHTSKDQAGKLAAVVYKVVATVELD